MDHQRRNSILAQWIVIGGTKPVRPVAIPELVRCKFLQIMPMLIENRIPVAHDHQKILARKDASTAAPLKDKHAFPSPWTLQGRGMVASPHKRDWLRLMKSKCQPRTLCHHGRQNACRATRPLPRICRVISIVMLPL